MSGDTHVAGKIIAYTLIILPRTEYKHSRDRRRLIDSSSSADQAIFHKFFMTHSVALKQWIKSYGEYL